MAIGIHEKSVASYSDWVAETSYSLNVYVKPVESNGYCYKCTTAGISGEAEPAWIAEVGATVVDGSVVWTCEDYAEAPNPLSAELDVRCQGGYPLKDVWVKSDGNVTFEVKVSFTGEDGTWRDFNSINVNNSDKLLQYSTPYPFMKVYTETSASNEIEIVAGE